MHESGGFQMKSMRKTFIPLIVIGLLIMSGMISTVFAKQAEPELLAKIKSVGGIDEYPNANYVLVDDQVEIEYNHKGQADYRYYELTRVLTEKGKNMLGERHLYYFKVYDTLTLHKARVIKPDGEVIEVPEDYIKDIVSGATEAMNIYQPDTREIIISFKGLQVGDFIEVEYTDHLFHSPMDGVFDGLNVFQFSEPIIHSRVKITGPEDMPLKYVVRRGEVNFEREKKDGKITYTWWAENQPAIVTEIGMPPVTEIAPTVIYTTVDTWEEISRWWAEVAESKMALSDELRAVIDSLTAGKSKQEIIASVYHYVAQEIRYMGLGTGKKKGFEPKQVVETFETKYGVCRDVAALMVAMLREVDIESEIVLTMVGQKIESEIPHLHFNHAIVAVKDNNGGYYFSDPTVENLPVLFPSYEQEQDVLICTKEGRSLQETPHQPASENLGRISAESELKADGSFKSDVVMVADATYDMIIRSTLKQMPKQQARMMFAQLLQSSLPGASLSYFDTSDPDDLDSAITIKFGYTVSDYGLSADDYLLVKMPLSASNFDILSMFILETAKLPEREHPLRIGLTFGAVEEETLILPDGYDLKSFPENHDLKYDHSAYQTAYTSYAIPEPKAGKLNVQFHKKFLVDSKQFSPEEYQEFLKILQARDKSSRGEIILVKEDS
ncbi:MAG: DUF3857 domain-containing protein [candidate division Zixibacteria bacterium]|nr:DUF3857 domain-containing protein [candidate division Zixibacteria bacterium]